MNLATRVAETYLVAAYSAETLDQVLAGMGLLVTQSIIVGNEFFDEAEIRKYLSIRRQFHDTFTTACRDLASQIEEGSFGSAARIAVQPLERIGAIPVKDAQRALVQTAKALRALKLLDLEGGDFRLRRCIFLAQQVASRGEKAHSGMLEQFIKELLKVQAVPTTVKTYLRKAIKYSGSVYNHFNETANPGAWFDMPTERKEKIRDLLARTSKRTDEIFHEFKDEPEKRRAAYEKNQKVIERLKNVAGVNLKVIERGVGASEEEPLDDVLKRESKLEADGPTVYVQEKIEASFRDVYAKDGTLPREYGKILTRLKKARTVDTVRRILTEAKNKRLIYEETAKGFEKVWASASKNLAVKKGTKLVPLQWEPISSEDFQKKHSTGRVVFDSSVSEEAQQKQLGRVSRALEDLEGIFGKGFCGKHYRPLEFNFEGSTGLAAASYHAWEDKNNWQPRVKFGDDYAGLLAHELSHYFDDLLASKIDEIKNPESTVRRKYGPGSSDLFGRTGVDLEYWASSGSKEYASSVIPELGQFADTVVATEDFKRWKDMTGSAHDTALPRAIKNLTGQEYYDLPKDHPYAKLPMDTPRFKKDWPPELLAETEKVYKQITDGDSRKLTYYQSGVEVWARMCEQYVATKLADVGIANPWLTQLTYDLDELPQMMDQTTFEEKIVPILDKIFATIKDRSLVATAQRVATRYLVAQRYLEARGELDPAIRRLEKGEFDQEHAAGILEAIGVIRNGERWKIDAPWYYGLGPRNKSKADVIIKALVRLTLTSPDEPLDPIILKQLARELKWLEKTKESDRKFQHGDFEIFPMGVTGPAVAEALESLDEAAKVLRSKFPQLLYGKVFVTKNLSGGHNKVARYTEDGDTIYLSLKAKNSVGDVYALCHEFGHRFFHKFWKNKEQRDAFLALSTAPEYGKIVFDKDLREKMADEYMEVANARRAKKPGLALSEIFSTWLDARSASPDFSALQKLGVRYAKGEDVDAGELRKLALGTKDFTVKTEEIVRPIEHVTPYGKTGGWVENFAEAFAHLVLHKAMPPGIAAIMQEL